MAVRVGAAVAERGVVAGEAGQPAAMLLMLVVKHILQVIAGILGLAAPVLPRRNNDPPAAEPGEG